MRRILFRFWVHPVAPSTEDDEAPVVMLLAPAEGRHCSSIESVHVIDFDDGDSRWCVPVQSIVKALREHEILEERDTAARALEVMRRHGCYVILAAWSRYDGRHLWTPVGRDGLRLMGDKCFPTPEAALLAAGEYLERQEGGE